MRAALLCRRLSTATCSQAFAPRRYSQYNTLSNCQRLSTVARCSGSEGAMKRPRGPEDPNVRVSKDMSRLLRHHPPPGAMDAAGWISLPVLLKHMRSKPTEEQIRQVVSSCPKQRFVLDDSTDPPRIRAAQGHSVELQEAVLEPVEAAEQVPVAVHVTSRESWQAIQSSGELRRMGRTHVHFATAPHHLRRNKWAEVLLRLDLQAALSQGHAFFTSTNGVLLCEGPLPCSLVREVDASELPEEWRQQQGQGQGKQGKGKQGQGEQRGQGQKQGQAGAREEHQGAGEEAAGEQGGSTAAQGERQG